MEQFGDERSTANGSGSGTGIRPGGPRRGGRRRAEVATADAADALPYDAPSPSHVEPLVIIDPGSPSVGPDERRDQDVVSPGLPPIVLPSAPDDTADVERWQRGRDLVAIGEVLVEMTNRPDGAFQSSFAGDAYNTLYYSSRLGLRTGLVTAVGDDLFTPRLISRIDDEGIDLSRVRRVAGRRNGIYFIEHDSWGERTFHYWREGSAATETLMRESLPELAAYVRDSHMLLITGVSLAVLKEPERLRELLERAHGTTTVVFDANYRAKLWSRALEYRFRVEVILPYVDVYLPSKQDLEAAYDDLPIDVLRAAADEGVRTIVMKDGSNGCAMLVDGELVRIPPVEGVHIVDTTGAGDAFNAGLIAGLIRGVSLREACELGQSVAARALMVPGAIDPGFSPFAIDASWRVG